MHFRPVDGCKDVTVKKHHEALSYYRHNASHLFFAIFNQVQVLFSCPVPTLFK